jgi:hypothetical protein
MIKEFDKIIVSYIDKLPSWFLYEIGEWEDKLEKSLQSSEVDVDGLMENLSLNYVMDSYWQEHYNFTEEWLKKAIEGHLSTSKVKEGSRDKKDMYIS